MRWPKFISTILHPIVIPTIGIILYFILTPVYLSRYQQYTLLGVVFVATYIIPILLLIFLKAVKYIESYEVHGIKERKIPSIFYDVFAIFIG
ncbi:hypothetical protein PJW08_02650 [Tenacibaculum finnmarkense]|nr:hypothetical protein PJW08_02650 [Tenacibaculum finnmarkense]